MARISHVLPCLFGVAIGVAPLAVIPPAVRPAASPSTVVAPVAQEWGYSIQSAGAPKSSAGAPAHLALQLRGQTSMVPPRTSPSQNELIEALSESQGPQLKAHAWNDMSLSISRMSLLGGFFLVGMSVLVVVRRWRRQTAALESNPSITEMSAFDSAAVGWRREPKFAVAAQAGELRSVAARVAGESTEAGKAKVAGLFDPLGLKDSPQAEITYGRLSMWAALRTLDMGHAIPLGSTGRSTQHVTAHQARSPSQHGPATLAVAGAVLATTTKHWGSRFASGVACPLLGLSPERSGSTSRGQSLRLAAALMPWKIPNTTSWQWLSVRELFLRERILMITEYIDENYANANIAMLLYLQSEDAAKPVQIYFAVPGAALKPALALYDTICQLKAKGIKVTTVSYSLCAGMGAFLMAAGTPGSRYATPNSLFLLSKTGLESPVQGQTSDIKVETLQMLRESQRVEEELAAMTKKSLEEIKRDLSRNFYLSAEAAAEYGLVDRVLAPETNKSEKLDKGVRDPWSGVVTKQKVGFGEFADPNQPRTAV